MLIRTFDWDDRNISHLRMRHGVEPEETEEVLAAHPMLRRGKRGRYAAIGPTLGGRYLTVVFQCRVGGVARVITAWDSIDAEKRRYRRERGRS